MASAKAPPSIEDLRAQGATTTLEMAGLALNLSRATTYRYANNGTIPTVKVGSRIRVPVEQLIDLIESPRGQSLSEAADDAE
jgi:excisionase family DNA binding protein